MGHPNGRDNIPLAPTLNTAYNCSDFCQSLHSPDHIIIIAQPFVQCCHAVSLATERVCSLQKSEMLYRPKKSEKWDTQPNLNGIQENRPVKQ